MRHPFAIDAVSIMYYSVRELDSRKGAVSKLLHQPNFVWICCNINQNELSGWNLDDNKDKQLNAKNIKDSREIHAPKARICFNQ